MVEMTEFVRATYPQLLRRAYLLTGDRGDAEDLVQDALARSWNKIARGAVDNPPAYVNRALFNGAVGRWRRRRIVIEFPSISPPGHNDQPDFADQVAEKDRLWRMLQSAPPRQRAVLILRYYEDLPEADVAALLGISVGTVRSQNAKGLARMRAAMTQSERIGGRS